jgi:threonine/homoserine/homoserine lactone efflux protein
MSRYLAFVALMTVLCLIPGPAVILAMQKAVTSGYRGALRTAAGVLAAGLVWAAAAVAGVSAVIVASQPAFLALRIAGAAYLVYLGARLLFAPKDKLLPSPPATPEDAGPTASWSASPSPSSGDALIRPATGWLHRCPAGRPRCAVSPA